MGQKKGWATWELPESEVKGDLNCSLMAGSCTGLQLFQLGLRPIIPQSLFIFFPPEDGSCRFSSFHAGLCPSAINFSDQYIHGYKNGWNVIIVSQALLMCGSVGAQYCCSASWLALPKVWLQIPSPTKDGSTRTSAITASLVRNGRGWRWDVHPNLCHWLKAALNSGHFEAVI